MTNRRIWLKVLLLVIVAIIAPGGLNSPPEPPDPTPLPWPALSPIVATTPVGYLPAATSVSPTGEYRISVSLDVPPGRAGMVPSVSLNYGSSGSDDVAGVGWTLSATSLIARCASTHAADGQTDGVDFTDDRLCLDGAKLVAIAGAYGADGTEYRTERDPFTKIVGTANPSGPLSFKAYLPDGRISTYTAQSALRHPDSVDVRDSVNLAYTLAETSDRNGNTIRYTYDVDQEVSAPWGLSVLLVSIDYTNSGLEDGRRQVVFTYDDRPDKAFAYTAGVRTRRDKRLAAVEMRAPNPITTEPVWSYALSYDPSPDTGRSLLRSIRKLDAAGVSLWAKQFEWAEHARPTFDFDVQYNLFAEPLSDPWGWDAADVLPADLDGDGKDELLVHFSSYYSGTLYRADNPASSLVFDSALDESEYYLSAARPIDLQNDGRTEILGKKVFADGSAIYRALTWDSAAGAFVPDHGLPSAADHEPVVVDIDGNGWADSLYLVRPWELLPNWNLSLGGVAGFGAPQDVGIEANGLNPEKVLDIDGDGRGDVLVDDPDFVPPPDQRGPNFVPDHTTVLRRNDAGQVISDKRWNLGNQRSFTLADINGDGLKDAVSLTWLPGPPATFVRYNRGNGFGPAVLVPGAIIKSLGDHPGVRVADFDRDGAEDLLVFRETADEPPMAVYLSRPAGFQEVPVPSQLISGLGLGNWNLIKVGDFNGDGLPDIAYLNQLPQPPYDFPYKWNVHLTVATQQPGESDVITAVRDELGAEPRETVRYTRAIDSIAGDTTCAYPQRCVRRGMLLVDEVKTYRPESPIPQRRLKYHFAGARADMTGRGFLGFSSVIADDEDSRARTITTYDNTTRVGTIYPFAGLPLVTETITPILSQGGSEGTYLTAPGGQATARVHRTETNYQLLWQYDHKSSFVHPSHSVETAWEQPCSVSGATVVLQGNTPAPQREVVRDFGFDEQGNMVMENHHTSGGVHGYTWRFFDNRVDDWLIRLEIQRSVTEAEAGEPLPGARITQMTYDSRGRLSTVVREPFDPAYTTTSSFEYTDDGLVRQVTNSAAGLASRHTSFFYDAEGVHTVATRNELGHVTKVLHHPALGVTVVTEDANGVQARGFYDGFGRTRRVEADGESPTNIDMEPWTNGGEEVLGIRVAASSLDGSEAYQRIDALGRVREVGTLGFGGEWIVSEMDYTAYGAPFYNAPPGEGAPGWPTSTQFDTLGRVQWVNPPDGAQTTFVHEMFSSASTDAKQRTHWTDLDKDGRPHRTREIAEDGHEIVTLYAYGDFGQLRQVTDAAGHVTTIEYDKVGRRKAITDPDRGLLSFAYDRFDQLVHEWDSIHDLQYSHDALGRLLEKDDTHGSPPSTEKTTFQYDQGVGASVGRLTQATSPDEVVTDFEYDTLGRPVKTSWTVDGEVFQIEQTYNANLGRPERTLYPEVPGRTRFTTDIGYNEAGYANTLSTEPSPALPLWRVTARDPRGLLQQARWAGTRVETRHYDASTGRLDEVRVDHDTPYGPAPLFDIHYDYEQGELSKRTDSVMERVESFAYDALDRLKTYTLQSSTNRVFGYGYDDLGNLTSVAQTADGVAQPTEILGYDAADKPHAARARTVGAQSAEQYYYDARGRMIESAGRGITYTSFDLPRTITKGPNKTTFLYDAFGARVKKTVAPIASPQNILSSTVTLGGIYERRSIAGKTAHHFYVTGDGEPVSEVVFHEDDGKEDIRCLARDGHGSIGLVFEPDGTVVERLFYEPFGGRVDAGGGPVAASASGMARGFTGHEEDDDLGLINMKGRVFDPVLRRFWTPDPLVGSLLVGQTLNRYSYVWNNPLRYVDPSGLDGATPSGQGGADGGGNGEEGAGGAADSFPVSDDLMTDGDDFFGTSKITVFKRAPEKAPLLPGAGGGEPSGGDAQADEGSSTVVWNVMTEKQAQRTAFKAQFHAPVTPNQQLNLLLAIYCAAEAEDQADKAEIVKAAVKGDVAGVADGLLARADKGARMAGAPILDAVKSTHDLPDHLDQVANGASMKDRASAAAEAGIDVANIAGAVLMASALTTKAGTAAKGVVALDTNAIIGALQEGKIAAVDAAIAGRTPLVPISAAKEFLRANGSGGASSLRGFLAARGGRLAAAGSESAAAGLRARAVGMGRALHLGDSRIGAGAVREGASMITNDKRFANFLRAIGFSVENW